MIQNKIIKSEIYFIQSPPSQTKKTNEKTNKNSSSQHNIHAGDLPI
jgi:hypothetical protein